MKRVLLTGASGFIGSNVLRYFLHKTDWTFVCLCSWRHKGSPLNVARDACVDVVTHDLCGPIPDSIGDFDYILNLASESHVDRSITHPVEFVENNVGVALNVLEFARAHEPEKLLQFSTDEVFGPPTDIVTDRLNPSNPYAASKGCQELIAQAYRATYGVPVIITHSNNVVGANQDKEKFVPKLVDRITHERTVQIHQSNGQIGRRFYNPVENVADALLFLLTNEGCNEWSVPECSIPGGVEMDNLEMAQLVAKILDRQLRYELVDVAGIRPGYDTAYQEADYQLFDMGWEPPLSLEEGMAWIASP